MSVEATAEIKSFVPVQLHSASPWKMFATVSTATHCNTLQHSAAHSRRFALLDIRRSQHCNTMQQRQHTSTLCNTLQHSATKATHFNTLQHTATLCSSLTALLPGSHSTTSALPHLQLTATSCNTLQHSTTHARRFLRMRADKHHCNAAAHEYKFSNFSLLLKLPYKITAKLTFETIYRQPPPFV